MVRRKNEWTYLQCGEAGSSRDMADETTGVSNPAETGPRTWLSRVQTFSSLTHRDYRLLWAGTIFSNMALWLQFLSLGWLVWNITIDPETGRGSVLLSGMVAAVRALPTLVIGPWAGVMVDRVDRRKAVIAVQLLLATVAIFFAFLVASGRVEVWHAFAYAAVSAVCFAFLMPALQALIANTVPAKDMGNAFALYAMTVTANRLIAAMIGGTLITTVGIKYNFFVEGGAYVAMALFLIPMRVPYREASTSLGTSVLANLKGGLRYIWKENPIILHLIILSLILNLVFMSVPALLPAYTGEVLNSGADVGGYLLAAQGVGGFVSTVLIASLGFVLRKGRTGLFALVLGSAAILVLAQSSWILLALAMMVLLGFAQTNFIVSNMTLVQEMAPDTLRGRVTSIHMMLHGVSPLAIFLIALFMELYTASAALTAVASGSLALSLYFLVTFRQVRRLE